MTRAMVTKKWKASSTVPPPRLTSTHEADRSPMVARAERQRRPPQESVARAAEAATITTPKASPGPSPTSRASRARAGTCSHRMSRMARWRLRQTSSGSERPWGRVPRTRLSNCTATRTFLLQATPSPAEPTSSAGGSHAQSFAASLRKCTRASVVNRHPTGDWHGPGNLTRFSLATTAERNVILKTALVQKFRSIENSGTVRLEPDVTCLVGKNESGKTAFLEALHQANPSGGRAGGSTSCVTTPGACGAGTGPRSPARCPSRPPSSWRTPTWRRWPARPGRTPGRQGGDRRADLRRPAAPARGRRGADRRAGRPAGRPPAPLPVLRRLQRAAGPGVDPAPAGHPRGRPPAGGADRPGPAAAGRGGGRGVHRGRLRGPPGRPGERGHHGQRGGLPLLEPEPGTDRRARPGLPRGRPQRQGRPAVPRRPHPQPAPPGDHQLRRALGRVRVVLLVRGRVLGAAAVRGPDPAAGRARPGPARRRPGRPAPLPGRAARRRPPGGLHHPLALHGRRHQGPPGPHRRGRARRGHQGRRRRRGGQPRHRPPAHRGPGHGPARRARGRPPDPARGRRARPRLPGGDERLPPRGRPPWPRPGLAGAADRRAGRPAAAVGLLGGPLEAAVLLEVGAGHPAVRALADQGVVLPERLLPLTELTGQSEAGLEDLFDDAFYLHLLAATGVEELDPDALAGEGSIVRRVEQATGSPVDRYRPARYLLTQQQRLLPAIGREPLHRFARLFATLDEL